LLNLPLLHLVLLLLLLHSACVRLRLAAGVRLRLAAIVRLVREQ